MPLGSDVLEWEQKPHGVAGAAASPGGRPQEGDQEEKGEPGLPRGEHKEAYFSHASDHSADATENNAVL